MGRRWRRRRRQPAAQGGDVEAAIAAGELAWRTYAEANNRKVAGASKIKRGPMAGQSVISHRWVSPDLFTSKLLHVRGMIAAEGTK